jgi:hypothetical protein
MKSYRWILITVLMLSLAFPAMTASAAEPQQAIGTAALSLTTPIPNPGVVGGDITFDLVISANSVIPGVGGAEVYVGYNPAMVSPPTTPNGAAEILPDFFGTSTVSIAEALPAPQCPGGTSPCIHLVMAGPPQTTQNGVSARFHFRGLAEGSACFTILQSVLKDADGYNVTHSLPDGQTCAPIVFRVTATGVVLRQGVPGNPNAGGGTLACSSVSTSGTGVFGPVNTTLSGGFTLPGLPVGTYTFRAVYPGYLASEKASITLTTSSPTTINLGTTILRGGDVNGDGAINILDIGSIISKFGRAGVGVESSAAFCNIVDEPADINDDGLVNISDLAIAAGNWGSVAPQVWP